MQNKPSPIIALFARGREIGYAMIEHGELVRYGVKTVKGSRFGPAFVERVGRTLSPLVKTAGSEGVIVMERSSSIPRPGALCQVLSRLSKRWKKEGYSPCFLTLPEVKRSLCNASQATHRELSEAILERYAILTTLFVGAREKYWERAFIAVAMADVAMRTLT